MELSSILSESCVIISQDARSMKQAFNILAQSTYGLADTTRQIIFEKLIARERLGSTGVGYGVAIPHARLPEITSLKAAFLKLGQPIDIDAPDQQPVDLIFLLLAPEHSTGEHLKALARISTALGEESTREQIRQSQDQQTIYRLLIQGDEEAS
jgi:PTS system nitrogen regulatory IIA component